MGWFKNLIKSAGYFFTGTYNGNEGNDNIYAASLNLGWGSGILTKGGDDSVTAAGFNLKIVDTWGDLRVFGAGAWTDISKTGNGNLSYFGASGGLRINHQGERGDIKLRSVSINSVITRIGRIGNMNIWGAGLRTQYKLYTTIGDITIRGIAAYIDVQRGSANILKMMPNNVRDILQNLGLSVGMNLKQMFQQQFGDEASRGNVNILGAGAYIRVNSTVDYGDLTGYTLAGYGSFTRIGISSNINLKVAGINNSIKHHSKYGNTKVIALGGRNYIERKGQYINDGSNGNVHASIAGLRNNIYHGTDYGNTTLYGAAISTLVTREGLVGNVNIYGIGFDTEINIKMLRGALTYIGAGASNRINISGYKNFQNNIHYNPSSYESYKSNINFVGLYNKVNHTTEYGDITVRGGGGYTQVKRRAKHSNLRAFLGGYGNQVELNSQTGNYTFKGAGIANILKNNSKDGYTFVLAAGVGNSLTRRGNGDGNIILLGGGNHIFWKGRGNLRAKLGGTTVNHLTKEGDGNNEFILGGVYGNIVNVKGNGRLILGGLGFINKVKKEGNGKTIIVLFGGVNIYHQQGSGNIYAFMLGGGNILNKEGRGSIYTLMAGGVNSIFQKGKGNIYAGLLGGGNIITKLGDGDIYTLLAGGANVLTHIGDGKSIALMFGGVNVLTKIGDGLSVAVMFGTANVFTHIGDGDSIAVMIGTYNIFTKVGGEKGDLNIAVMLGSGNVFTQIGDGDTYAFMAGSVNIFTKVGNGRTIVGMISNANIFTHIGKGMTIALMSGNLNIATKIGDGLTIGVLYQGTIGNIFTHIGNGKTFALLLGSTNIFTKVGNGMTMAVMQGSGNVFTHVGDGISAAVMIGAGSVFTKVGDDITIALMFAPPKNVPFSVGNIFTHIGDGISLAVMYGGKANIFTKVGDGLSIAVMIGGHANIFTHIGDGVSVALMANASANIYTKVGNGLTLALMQGQANIMTHIGDGISVGLAHGKANIITKVGNGELGVGLYGKLNIVTHYSSKKSNTFALVKGDLNIITKIGPLEGLNITINPLDGKVSDPVAQEDRFLARGDLSSNPMKVLNSVVDGMKNLASSTYKDLKNSNGGMLSVVAIGKANIITHIGRGATNVIVHGKANIITKVGNGRSIVFANGQSNIITTVGDGDSLYGVRGKFNIITKVGSGSSVAIAKGRGNIITKIGDGLHIGLMHGKGNLHTVVGDGMVINGQIGSFNINTKVGDGTSISVAKGKYNLNIQYGDGLGIYAGFGRSNISIKIGNGDYYGLAFELNKGKFKDNAKKAVQSLLKELKGTGISILASGTISRLVNGKEDVADASDKKSSQQMQAPVNLEGSSYSLEEEKVNDENTNDLSSSVTKTNEDGNENNYDKKNTEGSSSSNLENRTKNKTNKSQKAQDNATKDKNKAKRDASKAQNKIDDKNQKVTALRNKTNEVSKKDLKQNASKIQNFIQEELSNESSYYNMKQESTKPSVLNSKAKNKKLLHNTNAQYNLKQETKNITISVQSMGIYIGEGHKSNTIILDNNFKSGDSRWIKFEIGNLVKAIKIKIEFIKNTIKLSTLEAKYSINNRNCDFNKDGISTSLASTSTSIGYGIKNVNINGTQKVGTINQNGMIYDLNINSKKDINTYKYILIQRNSINQDINSKILNLSNIKIISNNQDITKHIQYMKMSSLWNDNYKESNLIDNDNNTFTHTSGKDSNPWIQIKLDKKYNIDELEITGRKNFDHRNKNIQVYLSNEDLSEQNIKLVNPNTYKTYKIIFNGSSGSLEKEQLRLNTIKNTSLDEEQNVQVDLNIIQNGSSLRNEFSKMQNDINSHIKKYSKKVKDTLKKVKSKTQSASNKTDITKQQKESQNSNIKANERKAKAIEASSKHKEKSTKAINDSKLANIKADERKAKAIEASNKYENKSQNVRYNAQEENYRTNTFKIQNTLKSNSLNTNTSFINLFNKSSIKGVNVIKNSLIKSSASAWNAGAFSNKYLDKDGRVSTTVLETNTARMIGLSYKDKDQHYFTIDYALFLEKGGYIFITEKGIGKRTRSQERYTTGDVLSVQREGNIVSYLKNERVFYTSNTKSKGKIYLDTSLNDKGATLMNIVIEKNIYFIKGLSKENNDFIKTSSYGWNSEVFSKDFISIDGSVSATAKETNKARMFGLSNNNGNSSYQSIDYAVYLDNFGQLLVYENANLKGNFGRYQAGDRFSVQRKNGNIYYLKNDKIFYTSLIKSTQKLYLDSSFRDTNATLVDVNIKDDFFTSIEGVEVTNNSLKKTGNNSWNTGAFLAKTIQSDGSVHFSVDETRTNKAIGLSYNKQDNKSFYTIDYAIYLNSNSQFYIMEQGSGKAFLRIYKKEDTFNIQRDGSFIKYYHNKNLIYTSQSTSNKKLYVQTALYDKGATFTNIVLKNKTLLKKDTSDIHSIQDIDKDALINSLNEAKIALRINMRSNNIGSSENYSNMKDKINALKSKISFYKNTLNTINELRKDINNTNNEDSSSIKKRYSMNELPSKQEGIAVNFNGKHLGEKDLLDNDNFSVSNLETILNKLAPNINSEIKTLSNIDTISTKERTFFNDIKKVISNPQILHLKLSDTITAMLVSKDKDFAYAIFQGDKKPLVDATGSLRNQFNVSSHTLDYISLKSLQENGSSGLSSLVSILASSDFNTLDEMQKSKIFSEQERSIYIKNTLYSSRMWKSEHITSILESIDSMREKDKYILSIKDKELQEIYRQEKSFSSQNIVNDTNNINSNDKSNNLEDSNFANNDTSSYDNSDDNSNNSNTNLKDESHGFKNVFSTNTKDILKAIDQGVSTVSLNQNINTKFEDIISLNTSLQHKDLSSLQFSKKHIKTLQRDGKISLVTNIEDKEITFKSNNSENSYNYKAIYNEIDKKYDIFYKTENNSYNSLKIFEGYNTNNLELNKNNVKNLIKVDGVKTQYFNGGKKIKLETSLGEVYNIELNKDNKTYSIYKEIHNKQVQLKVNEHTFNEGDNPKLILDKNAKRNLKNIDFEEIYNNAINNGIKAQNSDGDLFHDSLPSYVSSALDKNNIKLEVYTQDENGEYKNILELLNNSVEYEKSVKIIREELNGKYVYSIANTNNEGLISKKASISNKSNSLFLAIDSQINEQNYEIVTNALMENKLEITNSLESKKSIEKLREKTALVADEAISKVAKEMLSEMNIGDLRVDYKDQIYSAMKSTLIQYGISYFFTPLIKVALGAIIGNPIPNAVKTLIAKIVTTAIDSFLTQFVLPSKNLKPNAVQNIDMKNDTISKFVETALETSVNTVVCGINNGLHTGLYAGISNAANIKKNTSEAKYTNEIAYSYQQAILGEVASSIVVAASKVKLLKEGKYFEINKEEVRQALKKAFNNSIIIGKKIANQEKINNYSILSSMKNKTSWLEMKEKFLHRAGSQIAAEVGSGYLETVTHKEHQKNDTDNMQYSMYDGSESGYNTLYAMLANASGSMMFNSIHILVGRAQKYTYGINTQDGSIKGAQFSHYLKDLITKNKGNVELEHGFKSGLANLSRLNNTNVVNTQNKESINILLAGLFFELNANAREAIEKNISQGTQDLDITRNENLDLAFKKFNITYKSMLDNIKSIQENKILSNEDKDLLKDTLKNKLPILKQNVLNIQNSIPNEDNHLKKQLSNSLNIIDAITQTLDGNTQTNKTIISPYDKNHSIVFNQELNRTSKIGNKYLLIEKVYYNEDGQKIIVSPFIDIPIGAEVITLRQYGNTFKYMENGKEKTMKKQNKNDASLNLSSALFETFDLDFDDKKLKNIIDITNKVYENNMNIGHLNQTKPHHEVKLDFWDNLGQTKLDNLNQENVKNKMTNYDHQIIIQTQDDETVRQYATNLAQKHPKQTTIIQMSKDGSYKVVYGKRISEIRGKLRISPVGYGNITVENNKKLGGRSVEELAQNLQILNNDLTNAEIKNVSLVSCKLGSHDNITSDFGKQLFDTLPQYHINADVSVRSNYIAVQSDGTKITSDTGDGNWTHKNFKDKIIYRRDESKNLLKVSSFNNDTNQLLTNEANRLIVANKDLSAVDINKVGNSLLENSIQKHSKNITTIDNDKIEDINNDMEKLQEASVINKDYYEKNNNAISEDDNQEKERSQKRSISGNIQINVGDGEHTTLYKGSNNIDIKIGDGGHKTGMFGDNNILISIGDRSVNQKHTQKIGEYVAFEGAQILIGQRNIDYNYGNRNDFIVMLDKSIPVLPFVNPFHGASGIAQTLKKIALSNKDEQENLWSFQKAKIFSNSMSVLDITSSVEYTTLLDINTQNQVSSRGVKYDTEAYLNNRISGGNGSGV